MNQYWRDVWFGAAILGAIWLTEYLFPMGKVYGMVGHGHAHVVGRILIDGLLIFAVIPIVHRLFKA